MTQPLTHDDVVQVPGQLGLFDVPGLEAPGSPPANLSADRRRTQRQHQAIARGVHPLTGGRTYPDAGTCGDCVHRVLLQHNDRTYPKCERASITRGAASDCRAWWPACGRHPNASPGEGSS